MKTSKDNTETHLTSVLKESRQIPNQRIASFL